MVASVTSRALRLANTHYQRARLRYGADWIDPGRPIASLSLRPASRRTRKRP
jgi:hypothetical protein